MFVKIYLQYTVPLSCQRSHIPALGMTTILYSDAAWWKAEGGAREGGETALLLRVCFHFLTIKKFLLAESLLKSKQ